MPKDLLTFNPEFRIERDGGFLPVTFDGTIADALAGRLDIESLSGGTINDVLYALIKQMQDLSFEVATSVALTPDGIYLLQTIPSVGDATFVTNRSVMPQCGRTVLELHNHPGESVGQTFFSEDDLTSFAYLDTELLSMAVISPEGMVILIKTSRSIVELKREKEATGLGRTAWQKLGNELRERYATTSPDDSPSQRQAFVQEFAERYFMRLLFVPRESTQIEVVV